MDISVKFMDVGTEITFHLSANDINFLHLIKNRPCYGVSLSPIEIQNLTRYMFIKEAESRRETYFSEYTLDWRGKLFVQLK